MNTTPGAPFFNFEELCIIFGGGTVIRYAPDDVGLVDDDLEYLLGEQADLAVKAMKEDAE